MDPQSLLRQLDGATFSQRAQLAEQAARTLTLEQVGGLRGAGGLS